MADLTGPEKRAFERVLAMGGGYVLDFSNRTFSEFVMDSTGRDIYDARYDHGSGSKANRLRGFWQAESPHTVARLMTDLLDHAVQSGACQEADPQLAACRRAVDRLRVGGHEKPRKFGPAADRHLLAREDFCVVSATRRR